MSICETNRFGAAGVTIGLVVALLWAGHARGEDRQQSFLVRPGFLAGSRCAYFAPEANGDTAKVPLVLSVSGWPSALDGIFGLSAHLASAGYPVIRTPECAGVTETHQKMVRDAFGLVDLLKLPTGAFKNVAWRRRPDGTWGYVMAPEAQSALFKRARSDRLIVVAHCAGVKAALEAVKDVFTAPNLEPPPQVELVALNPVNVGHWYTGLFVPSVAIEATFANEPSLKSVLSAAHRQVTAAIEPFGGHWERLFEAWHRGQLDQGDRALVEAFDLRSPIKAIGDSVHRGRFRMTILTGKADTHTPAKHHGQRLHAWCTSSGINMPSHYSSMPGARHWFEGVDPHAFRETVLSITDHCAGRRKPQHSFR